MPMLWRVPCAISRKLHPYGLSTSLSRHHLPGHLGPIRSRAFTPQRHGTVTDDEESDIIEPDAEYFGNYSVILPPEPFVFGVSHIPRRPVPSHIPRPPYLTSSAHDHLTLNGSSSDGRIRLDSSEERRLRRAARLAREVLEYAGTLVQVETDIVLCG